MSVLDREDSIGRIQKQVSESSGANEQRTNSERTSQHEGDGGRETTGGRQDNEAHGLTYINTSTYLY